MAECFARVGTIDKAGQGKSTRSGDEEIRGKLFAELPGQRVCDQREIEDVACEIKRCRNCKNFEMVKK